MRADAVTLPVLLERDLYHAGWNGAISPYPGMSVKQKAMQSLRLSFLKKFQDDVSDSAESNALSLFKSINEKCRDYTLDTSSMTEIEAIALGEAKDYLYRFCFFEQDWERNPETRGDSPITLNKAATRLGVGNGANIGSYSTDFMSKVGTSRMLATDPRLFVLYKQAISSDPLWSSVESTRSKFRDSGIVRGSRLSFVPKTTEISRTICTEPILNMLFQKGIASILEERLLQVSGIDLRRQPLFNRQLAQLGSTSGKFGTIDLSSASDSMSLTLVRTMFPEHVVRLLELCRCPVTILPDGSEVELHMVSSMGNAFTFPLQTIFFTALVFGAYKALGYIFLKPSRHSSGNFAVFGDDIIVLSKAYGLVCRLLMLCGFDVNKDKSFNLGLFRESCGEDYFLGHNVRGVYLKTLKTSSDSYSAVNRLNRWSAKWGVPLPETISFLLRGRRFLPIPFSEMDDAGVKVPFRLLRKVRRNRDTGAVMYRFVYNPPLQYSVTDVESRPPKLRGWVHNPDAVLLAAIAGYLRLGRVAVRSNESKLSKTRVRFSPCWDWIPPEHAEMRAIGERWKSFTELNLAF